MGCISMKRGYMFGVIKDGIQKVYKTNSVRLKELVASGNHNMVGLSNPCYKRIKSPCNKCGVLMYSNNIKRHQNGTKCFSNGGQPDVKPIGSVGLNGARWRTVAQ